MYSQLLLRNVYSCASITTVQFCNSSISCSGHHFFKVRFLISELWICKQKQSFKKYLFGDSLDK